MMNVGMKVLLSFKKGKTIARIRNISFVITITKMFSITSSKIREHYYLGG